MVTRLAMVVLVLLAAGSARDWKIVHQRFSRWAKNGVFEGIFKLLASEHDNEYTIIEVTIVRAHQHSAGARKKTASKRSADPTAD
jgi:transposase